MSAADIIHLGETIIGLGDKSWSTLQNGFGGNIIDTGIAGAQTLVAILNAAKESPLLKLAAAASGSYDIYVGIEKLRSAKTDIETCVAIADLSSGVGSLLTLIPIPHVKLIGAALSVIGTAAKYALENYASGQTQAVGTNPYQVPPDFFKDLFPATGLPTGLNTQFNEICTPSWPLPPRITWACLVDPLAIDLDGDGLEVVTLENNVYFDHDGDGISNPTAWLKGDDAWLVLDRNGNGVIDSGQELFGNDTGRLEPLSEWGLKGFQALATVDSNGDGKFDANDVQFAEVRLWRDLNQNGISEQGELLTLNAAGIIGIDVVPQDIATVRLEDGSNYWQVGQVRWNDGSTTTSAIDLSVAVDKFQSEFPDTIDIADDVSDLPFMEGSGRLRSLWEAMSTGTAEAQALKLALHQFSVATTRDEQLALLDAVIIAWSQTTAPLPARVSSVPDVQAEDPWSTPDTPDRLDGRNLPAEWIHLSAQVNWDATGYEDWDPGHYLYDMRPIADYFDLESDAGGLNWVAMKQEQAGSYLVEHGLIRGWTGSFSFWTESAEDEFVSNNPIFATRLRALEAFHGTSVKDSWLNSKTEGFGNPNLDYFGIQIPLDLQWNLERAYQKLSDAVFNILTMQTRLRPYLDAIEVSETDGVIHIDAQALVAMLEEKHAINQRDALFDLVDLTKYAGASLKVTDLDPTNLLIDWISSIPIGSSLIAELKAAGIAFADVQHGTGLSDIYLGDAGANNFSGDAGNDIVRGEFGNDSISGDDGDDVLYGGDGNDSLIGGLGNDSLFGDAGNDTLSAIGTAGEQHPDGDGNHVLDGGAGDDTILGASGDDVLIGSSGDDLLSGADGDDTLDGGSGNDSLYGDLGRDSYLFDTGFGQDTILDSADGGLKSTIELSGYAPSDVAARREGGDLVIDVIGANDQLRIRNYFVFDDADQYVIKFGNGATWNLADVKPLVLRWTDNADTLIGFSSDDTIFGGGGGDYLSGGGGNDLLIGGTGNDTYVGGAAIQFMRGDGADRVLPFSASPTIICFSEGITPADVQVESPGNLVMRFSIIGTSDGIALENMMEWAIRYPDANMIEVRFADGTVWNQASLVNKVYSGTAGNDYVAGTWLHESIAGASGNDTILASDGNDVLSGGNGNDNLQGQEGNDTLIGGSGNDDLAGGSGSNVYIWGRGDGVDDISATSEDDVLQISEGLLPEDIDVVAVWSGMRLRIKDTSEYITLFSDSSEKLPKEVRFSDGTTWSLQDLQRIALLGSSDNDYLTGGSGADLITGQGGDDDLNGGGGDDTIEGGAGNDFIYGQDGSDVLAGGVGNDTLAGGTGDDLIYFDRGGGRDLVMQASGTAVGVDTLKFGAGISIGDLAAVRSGDTAFLTIAGGSDAVGLENYYALAPGVDAPIDRIEFANGSVVAGVALQALLASPRINTAPVAGATIPTIVARAGSTLSYVIPAGSIIDTDPGDTVTYYVESDDGLPAWLSYDVRTRTLSGTPSAVGTYDLWLRGSDGFGEEAWVSLTLNVKTANRAPTVNASQPITDQSVAVGGPLSYTFSSTAFRDADSDALTYSASLADGSALPSWLSFNATSRTFSGTSPAAAVLNVRVTANDGWGGLISDTFLITSTIQNLMLSGTSGANSLVGFAGNDSISGNGGDDTLTGNAGDDTLSGGTGNDLLDGGSGNDSLNGGAGNDIYVFNRGGGTDTVNTTDVTSATETLRFGAGITAADVLVTQSGQDMVLALAGSTDKVILLGYFAAAGSSDNKIDSVQFTSNGTSWTRTQLEQRMGNRTPIVAAPLVDQVATEDQAFSYVVPVGAFTDPDAGTTLTYSAMLDNGGAWPSWLTFNASTRTLSGTPLNPNVGSVDVRITATDGTLSVSDVLKLTVINTNDAPTVSTPSQQSATQGQPFSFVIPAGSDVDVGDSLSYEVVRANGSALPSWLTFNAVTRTLSGTPVNADVGTLSLQVRVKDVAQATASSNFNLVVANVNDAPQLIAALADQTATQNSAINFTLPAGAFADIDAGDTLGYSATLTGGGALPSWLSFNATSRTFSGTPNAAGTVSVTVRVTDVIGAFVTDSFDIVVTAPAIVNQTLNGTTGADTLTGGAGNDTLIGNTGNDSLIGAAGNDSLDGGAGADSMNGGTGDDTYVVDSTSDSIVEAAGEGWDTVRSSITYTLGATLEDLTLTGTAHLTGNGNAQANLLIGNAGHNTLNGGADNDTLQGVAGNDTLTGGVGNDILDGGIGNDSLVGGAGDDLYRFGRGYGADLIQENDSTAGNTDVLSFLSGIATDQIWFVKNGNNLEVSVIGTSDKAVLQSWYLGNQYHLEQFKTSDGKTLVDSQVQNLVSAMASFTPPTAGQTTLPTNYQASLLPIITSNWTG